MDVSEVPGASAVTPIGATLVSARSGDEYGAMFDLDLASLRGRRILDCPGGAASFAADATALGAEVTAVDPVYADPHDELVAHARTEAVRGNDYLRREPDRFVWTYFRDVAHHLEERSAAVDRFAADRARHPDRYVAASLPDLPFPDDAFDLALSSHLLFTYDDRLDVAFHEHAIVELLRVSHEVRCFPTLSMTFERSAAVAAVVAAAEATGAQATLVPSPYEFQRGGNEMLVARRKRRP